MRSLPHLRLGPEVSHDLVAAEPRSFAVGSKAKSARGLRWAAAPGRGPPAPSTTGLPSTFKRSIALTLSGRMTRYDWELTLM